MICAQVHDFIRGTKIALPRPVAGKSIHPSRWDIVRSNQSAEQLVIRHLKALAAIKTPGRSNITSH
jgi:hypothetical protein